MDIALYAHPWDLRLLYENGGLERLRDLGINEVAMAVSYHAGRWLLPWNPEGMVRFLEDGVVHYRPRGDYGRLRPKPSSEVGKDGPSPLERFCAAAEAAGMRARAWAVLTHNTRLGELHPECAFENAFGDRYPYALCPANRDVQQYIVAMCRDLAAHRGLHTTELESLLWMGHRHNGHHDKSSFVPDAYSDLLLSLCFCASCRTAMSRMPLDKAPVGEAAILALRQAVAVALKRHFAASDCLDPPRPALDREGLLMRLQLEFGATFTVVLGHRILTGIQLATQLQPLRRAGCRFSLQTNHDALRGGPAIPLGAFAESFDELALTTYAENPDGVMQALPHLLAARDGGEKPLPAERRPRLRVCLHPRAPFYKSDADVEAVRALCASRDVDSVALYHFGLLPGRTLERVTAVLRA